MKLLTSEIVTLFADSLLGSYLKRVEEAYYKSADEMRRELRDLEEGGVFSTIGIKNFLEADYFGWYLDEWNSGIAQSFFELTQRLLEYEPATVELNPERVKDLFKRLYQNLVPRDIRHSIGEYFTPDWLAEYLLDEVVYDGNPEKRLLDPACGSGTFLVLAIKRIREYAQDHFIDERSLVTKIIENVRGIDLNPLAVLAAKANYIIALSGLIRDRPRDGIEIPIYLADSISVVSRVTGAGEREFELHTNEGKFWITKEVIDRNLLQPVLSLISDGIKVGWTKAQFEAALSPKIPLSRDSIKSFVRLYDKIDKLQRIGKNGIWTSLLKNSFSPMLLGKFDYVVGNPPWVNWENLPEFYRESTKHLWDEYGLIGKGAFKKDIAMLFVARCHTLYVNQEGKLAFLVPFTIFKNPSGSGYRTYLVNKSHVRKIYDLVELSPFEGATNRTAMIVLENGTTEFPIPCVMWSSRSSKGIHMEAELDEVKNRTKRFEMIFAPIKSGKPDSPWMIITEGGYGAIQKALGKSEYVANEGVNTRGANAVFYVKILQAQGDLVMIRNDLEEGKTKYRESRRAVETSLVFPLLGGEDVKRWYCQSSDYILMPHDESSGTVIKEDTLKTQYWNAFRFLLDFQDALATRKFYGKSIKGKFPFYALFQVNTKTFSPYKVVWKSIAGRISGKPEFDSAVVTPIENGPLGAKVVIPNTTLVFIPFASPIEAFYCAAILNSSLMKLVVASYTIETRIPPNITENVFIPQFDSRNPLHQRLGELSESAHNSVREKKTGLKERLETVEREIDETVAKLYGITNKELAEVRMTLRILTEGEAGDKPVKIPSEYSSDIE